MTTGTKVRVDDSGISAARWRELEESHPFCCAVHRAAASKAGIQPPQLREALLEVIDRGPVPQSTLAAVVSNAARMIVALHGLYGQADRERQAAVDELSALKGRKKMLAGRTVAQRSVEGSTAALASPQQSDPPDLAI